MKPIKKILLTGASGTVGYEVLKQLCEINNYEITAFDMRSKKSVKKLSGFKDRAEIVYGNIINRTEVEQVCSHKDVVIHLAAIIPPLADEKPGLAKKVNTTGTKNLIGFLEKHSPHSFFLYSSSVSVYGDRLFNPLIKVGDPLLPSAGDEYAKTKIEAEELIRNCRLDWSIFRLAAIMGGHKMSKLMFHQPLNTSLEIATPEDTARAFVYAIEKRESLSKKIFNLGGGEKCRISYEDFLLRSFEIAGLGKLDFLPKTFAEKNFHCGFYLDGRELENLLHFRKDDMESFFRKEEQKISFAKKLFVSAFRRPIKKILQKQSEPLAAWNDNNNKLIDHFFRKNHK